MKEPVFNPGGIAALIVIVGTLTGCYFYSGWAKAAIMSGSWFVFGLMALFPFVLAFIVGDETDRADFHKFFNWIARKLRFR